MLIDRLKRGFFGHVPTIISWPSVKINVNINDSIIFDVKEKLNDYNDKASTNISKAEIVSLPSFLPYDNLCLNYSDGIDWSVQKTYQLPDGKFKLIISVLTATKKNLPKNIEMPWFARSPRPFVLLNQNREIVQGGLIDPMTGDYTAFKEISNRFNDDCRFECSAYILGLYHFLEFLSCKNIIAEKTEPAKKLQKKRFKKNKLPLSSYYILKIKPTHSQKSFELQGNWSNRVHLCRGHIKTYTKEKPLFGSYVGNVWCPPHARGNKDNGIVHKDYLVN